MALRLARGDMAGLLDHLHDMREMPVRVGRLDVHVVLGGADAAAFDLLERNGGAGFERSDGVDDGGLVRAGMGQRAHQHVSADPGECVKITSQWHKVHCTEELAAKTQRVRGPAPKAVSPDFSPHYGKKPLFMA